LSVIQFAGHEILAMGADSTVSGLTAFLKRARDNYYVSRLITAFAAPLHSVCTATAAQIQRSVHRNGAAIRLPNGQTMRIARDNGIWIASALFWNGLDGHEPETSRALRFLFERSSTFVDVGANYGIYSILGALWNPRLQVVAFEPVPRIHEGLRKNVALNRLQDRIVCENLALADNAGKAAFFLPDGEGQDLDSAGTLVADGWQARKNSPRIEVETVRFDDYEKRRPMRVDLVKIDVEDLEADVLAGMRAVVERDRPFIVCEVLPRAHRNERTRNIVESLQYQPYWITPAGFIRVSRFDFSRNDFQNFLLSPVSTPDTVLRNLEVLWDLKCSRPAA
jgi:FkbM family methyltransferase